MKKQTAVEWLASEMFVIDWTDPHLKSKLEQAKAMEKEQIEEAYWERGQDVPVHGRQCQQYYNETYKGGEQ